MLAEAVEAAKKQAEESLLDLEDVEQDAVALGKCMQEEALQRTVLEQEWKRSAEQMALYRQEKQRGEQSLAELEQEEKQLAKRTAESAARLQELERSSQGWQDSFDAAQKKQRDLYGLRMEKRPPARSSRRRAAISRANSAASRRKRTSSRSSPPRSR